MSAALLQKYRDIEVEAGASSAALRISHRSVKLFAVCTDCATMIGSSVLASFFHGFMTASARQDFLVALGVGALASVIFVPVSEASGQYRWSALAQPGLSLRRLIVTCIFVCLSLTAILVLLKTSSLFSRGALLLFFALQTGGLLVNRVAGSVVLRRLLARDAIGGHPILVIGDAEELASLSEPSLIRHFGVREIGRIGIPSQDTAEAIDALRRAIELGRNCKAAGFCIALDWGDTDRLTLVKSALRASPLPVQLLPDRRLRGVLEQQPTQAVAQSLVIDLQRAPLTWTERLVKRAVDILVASSALLILSPVMLAVALAIRLDSPGPVIFKQRRNGFDHKSFQIFKFRSMTVLQDGSDIMQAHRNDQRVTRVGRFIRRTSVDELPQFLNVLRGDMSFVGPRPHALAHDDLYNSVIETYCLRHHVKPGITGWAQVMGHRGETRRVADMKARVDLDIWYVTNWSLLLDFRIMVSTFLAVLKYDAY